ncbi:MAG: CAP domain-containing protein [Rhizobacter sp.]|nr:CAP domain-containing protein [Rhizobacter sp.]
MSSPPAHSHRLAACALATALLAACGGGGDSAPSALSGTTSPAPAPAPEPGQSPAPAPAPSAPSTATCGLSDFANSALARINQIRAAGATCGARGSFAPAAALGWSSPLTQSGEGHSRDMATANYFSHTSLDGRTLADRVNATGYAWSTIGENIAAGYSTVNSVMDGWTASDGHCANLMNPNFTEVGLACVPGASGSQYNTYWTMNLGRPQ